MNRPEVYHKSVQILYDAYFNDTLQHCNCAACAVGNLILAAHDLSPVKTEQELLEWPCDKLSYTGGDSSWYDVVRKGKTPSTYINNMLSRTGYSIKELVLIESAFEKVPFGDNKDEYMFNGLVAVLEALKQIHEVRDQDLIQANHKRFKEHHEKKLQTV